MIVTHYGPANGPDGLGQAMACGTNAANRWQNYTQDVTKVTCRRCLKTREVRAAAQRPEEPHRG